MTNETNELQPQLEQEVIPAEIMTESESLNETQSEIAAVNYSTKEEVVLRLRTIAEENNGGDKVELDLIKQVFYKLHKAEQLAARNAFIEAGGDAEAWKPELDTAEENFKALMTSIRQRRAQIAEELEKLKQENLQKKQNIIDRIKELTATPEEANTHFDEFKQLQAQWKEIKPVPAEKATELWKNYQYVVEQFYDILKLNSEAREYDFRKNLDAKVHLCQLAEALVEEEDVIAAFNKLQGLHAEYKEIGPVAKEYREAIWERFKGASTIINKRHQDHFEAIKAQEEENLHQKEALCDNVEGIDLETLSTATQWEEATKQILESQATWKTIGFASHKNNTIIFDRFRAACDRFFTAKAEFYKGLKDEQQANLERKRKLVEEAEALKDSKEWRSTSDRFIALQKQWKEIGAVPRKYSETLWKSFSAAADAFFAAKNEANADQRQEEQANLEAKRGIIEQLRALAADTTSATIDAVRELQEKWNAVGFVPFREKDKLYKEYRALADELYKAFGEAHMQRRLEGFQKNIHKAVENGESTLRREHERLMRIFETRKSEVQTYENNLTFLSASSKKGNALVDELNRKVSKLREELELLTTQIKALEKEIREEKKNKE